jgi:hypothetical protein
MEKGELIGEARERLNIAKKMMSEGMNVDLVSKVTGLSKEDIEDLCPGA